jgi:hypothetical protein
MSYLDWKKTPLRIKSIDLSQSKIQLFLALSDEWIQPFVTALEDVFVRQSGELRMHLPEGWVLFWKLREEGNRAIVAHPQANEWVGTIALDANFGQMWISSLKKIQIDQSLLLSGVARLERVSNLELILSRETLS